MNTTYKHDSHPQPEVGTLRQWRAVCGHCYQAVVDRLSALKSKIEREFVQTMAGYEQLLRASVNEAEALAWQTPYPHLFFPTLAEEKAAEARRWAVRQRIVRERTLATSA